MSVRSPPVRLLACDTARQQPQPIPSASPNSFEAKGSSDALVLARDMSAMKADYSMSGQSSSDPRRRIHTVRPVDRQPRFCYSAYVNVMPASLKYRSAPGWRGMGYSELSMY